MKKDRSYMMIKISFIMIMISFVTFYGTDAFFTDSEELSTNINITTGTLDIQLTDSTKNTIGDQSFILDLDQTTKSQLIGNLTVKDIGTLSSNLSARVLVNEPTGMENLISVFLVDSNGNNFLLSENYEMVNNIHNTGTTFGVKISYSGTLPLKSSGLAVTVELSATQPNDDYSDAKMFTDIQVIRFIMPQDIQLAFNDGIPIVGTIKIDHKEDAVINLLPLGLNVENVNTSFDNKQFTAFYDSASQSINVHVDGTNNNAVMKITIILKNGQKYVFERDIKSINTP